jgi:hypothetical protein
MESFEERDSEKRIAGLIASCLVELFVVTLLMVGALFIIISIIPDHFPALAEHENFTLYSIFPFFLFHIIVSYSIYKTAKALGKNAFAWLFACIAFPMVLYFAIPYFSIVGVYRVVKVKLGFSMYEKMPNQELKRTE